MKYLLSLGLLLTPAVALGSSHDSVSYHAINLFDSNPTTQWCAHYRDGGVSIQVTLRSPQQMDAVQIVGSPRGSQRVTRIRVQRDAENSQALDMDADNSAEAVFRPAQIRTVTLTVSEVEPMADGSSLGDNVFCMADVHFLSQGAEVEVHDASVVPAHLAEQIVGNWRLASSDDSGMRRLTFNLDGTWTLSSKDGAKGAAKTIHGTYELVGKQIVMHASGRRSRQFVGQVDLVQIQGDDSGTWQNTYCILVVRGHQPTNSVDGKYTVQVSNS